MTAFKLIFTVEIEDDDDDDEEEEEVAMRSASLRYHPDGDALSRLRAIGAYSYTVSQGESVLSATPLIGIIVAVVVCCYALFCVVVF